LPAVDGGVLAALARLDLRAAHAGAQLVVSTSVAALDDVFACMDQSNPQLLVDPTRAERVIALGRVLARVPRMRLRDLAEEDRLMLLRLTEQVSRIAERLDRLSPPALPSGGHSGFRFEAPRRGFGGHEDDGALDGGARLIRRTRPPLPDPRLLRRILRQRQLRARFFDGDLFADPAWDILLDLTAARAEHKRVSVTSLCIASGVPPTTALRWIGQMTEAGLLERIEDDTDRRRAFIALSDRAADAMARYFAELGSGVSRLI
jgi:DNA-binding transcriptional ArsR family regulator